MHLGKRVGVERILEQATLTSERERLAEQRGLADARLAREHDDGALTAGDRVDQLLQRPQLALTTDERTRRRGCDWVVRLGDIPDCKLAGPPSVCAGAT